MFVRVKKSGKYQYLQIVYNKKVKGKVIQRVITTMGRHRAPSAFAGTFLQKVLLVLSDRSQVLAQSRKIGPAPIFEQLWQDLGIGEVIKHYLRERKFEFDVEGFQGA